MTTTDHDHSAITDAQRARIAQLRARRNPAGTGSRRASTPEHDPQPRRRHPARKSRVAAAGLGATTMFGIVTVLGLDHPFSGADRPAPTTPTPPATAPAPPSMQIVIHRIPATTRSETPQSGPTDTQPDEVTEPIILTATPVIQTVTVTGPPRASAPGRSTNSTEPASTPEPAPAPPAATTSGSG